MLPVREAGGCAEMRWWKKRKASCNETYTGSSFARRESEQTSTGCFVARESVAIGLMKESK